jgi:DNA-binding Lrp family transcriptional regulator
MYKYKEKDDVEKKQCHIIELDKTDKRILFELDRNSRIPDTKLAKLVRKSKESVRYRIKQLEEKGIINGYTIWIDPARLGYSSAKIYLNLANIPEKKKEFIEYVKNDKRLFWLGIAEGAWNAGLTFFVKTNREFFELKNELFSKFKDLILESHTAVPVNVNFCQKTFLHNAEAKWQSVFEKQENYVLDDIEKKIISELFRNSRISIVDIARKYKTSHKTTVDIVRSRIKRLEEKKIIVKYTINLNFVALGYEFYKTFLYFKNLTKKDEYRLMEYTRAQHNTIHLVKQISPWDIELEIMCNNYQEYNSIIDRLTKEFVDIINKVETAIMSEDYIFPAKKMVFEG